MTEHRYSSLDETSLQKLVSSLQQSQCAGVSQKRSFFFISLFDLIFFTIGGLSKD